MIFVISLASFVTASFAWFNFNNKKDVDVLVQTGSLSVSSFDYKYYSYAYDNSQKSNQFLVAEQSNTSSLNYSSSASMNFTMNFFDPYYYEIYNTQKPNTNMIIKLTFQVTSSTPYDCSVKCLPLTLASTYSVNTDYQSQKNINYLLSDIVYFQATDSSSLDMSSATTDELIYSTASTAFSSTSSYPISAFDQISVSKAQATGSLSLLSKTKQEAGTATYTCYINIAYDSSHINDLITKYGEGFVINEPSFTRNFYFSIEATQA